MFGIILGHLIQPRMWYAPDEAVRAPFFISHLFQTWIAIHIKKIFNLWIQVFSIAAPANKKDLIRSLLPLFFEITGSQLHM